MTITVSKRTQGVRPEAKRDVCATGIWRARFYGRDWWGNPYMLLEGEPPWPDVYENSYQTESAARPKFARYMRRVMREPFTGEAFPLKLEDVSEVRVLSDAQAIRRARHASNGQLARGNVRPYWGHRSLRRHWEKDAYNQPGAAAIAAKKVAFVERRCGPGDWFLDSTRDMFAYVVDGRTVAIVMGIRRTKSDDLRLDGAEVNA